MSLLHGDAAALPIATGVCDRVYSESVIGIQDQGGPEAMLAEIHRALKPGGRCVINEAIWRATASDAEIDDANEQCMSAFGLRQASESRWRTDDWNRAMEQAGFVVLAQDPASAAIARHRNSAFPGRAVLASRALSLLQRTDTALRRSARQRKMAYRALLDRHSEIGRLIENRLFVLERPR